MPLNSNQFADLRDAALRRAARLRPRFAMKLWRPFRPDSVVRERAVDAMMRRLDHASRQGRLANVRAERLGREVYSELVWDKSLEIDPATVWWLIQLAVIVLKWWFDLEGAKP